MRSALARPGPRAGSTVRQVVTTNLATNPDAETFGAVANVRVNYCTNPSFEGTTAGWIGAGGTAPTLVAVAGSALVGASFMRMTPNLAAASIAAVTAVTIPVTAGESCALSASVRGTPGRTATVRLTWTGGAGGQVYGTNVITSAAWQQSTLQVTVPAGVTAARLDLYVSSTGLLLTDAIEWDGVLFERNTTGLLPYFDGSTPAAGDFTYAWSGTAHASTSLQRAPAVNGVSNFNGALAARWSSVVEHAGGARSWACMPMVNTTQVGFIWTVTPLLAGRWITATMRVKAPVGYLLALTARTSAGGGATPATLITGTGAWQDVTVSSQAASDGALVGVQLVNRAPYQVGVPWYVDRLILVVDANPYTGPYFDGRTPATADTVYAWTGAADASTSTSTLTIIVPDPDRLLLLGSHILTCEALVFPAQPTGPADTSGRPLDLTDGTFTDDAARGYARGYELRVTNPLTDITPGQWVRVHAGVALPDTVFSLPALMVTSAVASGGGTLVTCEDIGACLDEVVFEADATMTGTLRSVAAALTTGVATVTRPVDVTGVPAITVPDNTVAEFGHGRWDFLLTLAAQVGVDLLWTDDGDLVGTLRTDAPPASAARLDTYLVDGGQAERNRPVTRAVVLVARDRTLAELVGVATSGDPAGTGLTVSDRQDGDASTTQAQADALAAGLLARRRAERNTREVDVAPAPWLEAGTDTVDLDGRAWWVRAVRLGLPSLATTLTLRDAS